MTDVPVVVCPSCDGVTFTLNACRCTDAGDRFLVYDEGRGREPYRDCQRCRGVGMVAHACHGCGQTGRRRGQLVLTMVNLDTGAVASVNVVPGVVEPRQWPGSKGWHLPVAPLVRQLAAEVGAATWYDVPAPRRSPDGPVIFLPHGWQPDLPELGRRALEAQALAGQSHYPWHVFLGRTAAAPVRDLDRELARMCRLADLLRLDLVVQARRRRADGLSWHISYEVTGADVPAEPRGWAEDLPAAVAATTVPEAMYGLAERGRAAPAHYLRTLDRRQRTGDRAQPTGDPEPADLDQLARRILADCTDPRTGLRVPGAQAIWRDGRWWHTSLRIAGTTESLTERDTGQVVRRQRTDLRRHSPPPAPSWLGPPIPYDDCPDCDPDSRLRACVCTVVGQPAGSGCPTCGGAGVHPSELPCHTCRDSHRVYHGVSVTISDLDTRVVHLNWRAGDPVRTPLVATQSGGKSVHQLPGAYRLARWAGTFGVRPEDLTELDGGGILGQDLRDGIVTVDGPGVDPAARYLALAARGQPAGRLLIRAARPDVPSLADVVRLVLGLHLAVTVTIRDHSPDNGDPRWVHGTSWDVTITTPDQPVTPADPPVRPTPESAIEFCLEYLETAVAAAVPADPARPIPIPQSPRPAVVDNPVPMIGQLGRHHAGQPVAVRFDRAGCHVHLRDRDTIRHLVSAGTLAAALTALGLHRR